MCRRQGCSGAGTRRNAVPVNIFQAERRSGKYSRGAPERLCYGVPANIMKYRQIVPILEIIVQPQKYAVCTTVFVTYCIEHTVLVDVVARSTLHRLIL